MAKSQHTPGWYWSKARTYTHLHHGERGCVGISMSLMRDNKENQDIRALIVAACNACMAVNPDNPVAVAKALPELVAATRAIQAWHAHQLLDLPFSGEGDAAMSKLTAALAAVKEAANG